MAILISMLRWGWLLTIALFMPISLPVGGAQIKLNETFQVSSPSQLIAGNLCEFRICPSSSSPVLRRVSVGTPLQILRTWNSSKGSIWFHVEVSTLSNLELDVLPKRGWIKI